MPLAESSTFIAELVTVGFSGIVKASDVKAPFVTGAVRELGVANPASTGETVTLLEVDQRVPDLLETVKVCPG
jgi:hypothetical protein